MHEVDDAGPTSQGGQERDAILHIDDDVGAQATGQSRQLRPWEDSEAPTAPGVGDPSDHLVGDGPRIGRRANRHLVAARDEPLGHFGEVFLGATGLGVGKIPPREEENAIAGAHECPGVRVGSRLAVDWATHTDH